jgi:small subunit ribosomal protein S6
VSREPFFFKGVRVFPGGGGLLNEYELLYIVSPRVPADEVNNAVERVSTLIRNAGGEVLSVDNWGRRRLAYPIRQYFEGSYVLTTMRMPPAGAAGLEATLVISEEIIRHLLISGIVPRTSGGRGRDDRDRDDRDRDQAGETAPVEEPLGAEAAPEVHEEPAAVEEPAAEPAPAAAE